MQLGIYGRNKNEENLDLNLLTNRCTIIGLVAMQRQLLLQQKKMKIKKRLDYPPYGKVETFQSADIPDAYITSFGES